MTNIKDYVEDRSIPEPNSGCWLWLLSLGSHGYGQGWTKETGVTTAHRLSHIAFKGPIPEGFEVDHLCMNKVCVNPDHLEATSKSENLKRAAKAAGKTVCDTLAETLERRRSYKLAWQRADRAKRRTIDKTDL